MVRRAQIEGLGEFAHRGFTLKHPDNHGLFLMHEGERIAVFSKSGATSASLQAKCAEHLAKSHSKRKADDTPF